MDDGSSVYESVVPYEDARIHAAAIYCSDGRFGEQFDDFLQTSLRLPRYDRLAVPGGPACLAGHFAAYQEETALIRQLEFLVSVHQLETIVLVAHQGCAFYAAQLHASPLGLLERQREDLLRAVERVRFISRDLKALAFFARRKGGLVWFERVPT